MAGVASDYITIKYYVDGVLEYTDTNGEQLTSYKFSNEYTPQNKDGFKFDGWYSDSSYTNKVYNGVDINGADSVYGRYVICSVKVVDVSRVMYNNESMVEVVYNDTVVWPLDKAGTDYSDNRFTDVRYSFTSDELSAMKLEDIVYYDGTTNKLTLTATDNPIGVVFDIYDGKCVRLMSLYPSSANTPDVGCVDPTLKDVTKFAPKDSYAYNNLICPTSSKSDGWHNCKYWYNYINNLDDLSWQTTTKIENTFAAPAAMVAWRYHTVGTEQGMWYIPASANEKSASLEIYNNSEYYKLWSLISKGNNSNYAQDTIIKKVHENILKDNFTLYSYMRNNYDHSSSYEYKTNGCAMYSFGYSWGCAFSDTQTKDATFAHWLCMQLWPRENMKKHLELSLD